jgi:hypothetical protein
MAGFSTTLGHKYTKYGRWNGLRYSAIRMFRQQSTQLQAGARKRRSRRLVLSIPVVAHRLPKKEQSFYERTRTLVVNAHGALISLAADVVLDQTLVLQNALTGEERECRIVFTDRNRIGPIEVGLEFRNPAPYFWRVAFPPDDWILPELRAKVVRSLANSPLSLSHSDQG